jgi:phosphohistidine phosphatase
MRVTLIRHGEAGTDASRDAERALTKKGRSDVRRLGRGMALAGVRLGAVVSSPLVRAVQTAELMAAALGYRGRITASDRLVPEAPPAAVVALLSGIGKKSVALVAHEPILSEVAALLLGLSHFRPLRKAEAIRIRVPDGPGNPGVFRWRIDPDTGKRHRT